MAFLACHHPAGHLIIYPGSTKDFRKKLSRNFRKIQKSDYIYNPHRSAFIILFYFFKTGTKTTKMHIFLNLLSGGPEQTL